MPGVTSSPDPADQWTGSDTGNHGGKAIFQRSMKGENQPCLATFHIGDFMGDRPQIDVNSGGDVDSADNGPVQQKHDEGASRILDMHEVADLPSMA